MCSPVLTCFHMFATAGISEKLYADAFTQAKLVVGGSSHWILPRCGCIEPIAFISLQEGENIAMAGSLTLFQPLEPCCSCLVSLRNL